MHAGGRKCCACARGTVVELENLSLIVYVCHASGFVSKIQARDLVSMSTHLLYNAAISGLYL